MTKSMNLFSGIFFDNNKHITWEYNPPNNCELPEGISEGDEQIVQLYSIVHERTIGVYGCFIEMNGEKIYDQPILKEYKKMNIYKDGPLPLHITLYTGKDSSGKTIPPVEAGILLRSYRSATTKGITPTGYSPLSTLFTWIGKWGFYKI